MAHHHNKIILLLMIKNESKIIERCISNAIDHVDAVSVLDTGSTDNTVEVCEAYLSKCGKPYHIKKDPFKNFGYSRTVSFQKAQELCKKLKWDPETTYAMAIDGDMVIKPSPEFKNYKMELNGYNIIQANGFIKYYNTRFMKCGFDWKCVGGTHEYWSGDPTGKIPYEVIYIDDRNDGGCKSDKFERDVRLFKEDIKADPNNPRPYYYLGQSLKDLGKFKEAIEMFEKRIELGGWYEEAWYAHYMIGKCYDHMDQPLMMELWMNKAFERHQRRAEPLYFLTRRLREKGQNFKAYHYYLKGKDIPYPKDDVLFIEDAVYNGLFDYENTILACYVNNKTKQDALCDVVSYINRGIPHHVSNVWDNMHWYTEPLNSNNYRGKFSAYQFKDHEQYKVSSCSLVPWTDAKNPERKFLLNTRFVNYSIDRNGHYHMRCPDGNVRTKNGFVYLDDSYEPLGEITMMEEVYERHPSNIEGMEDVRLFEHEGKLRFMASSKNITNDGNIVISYGEYHPETAKMDNMIVLHGPRPEHCQKNWIYVDEKHLQYTDRSKGKLNVIYGWNPMEIGSMKEDNTMDIHTTYSTPAIFSRFRGSSRIVEYNGKLYAVVHLVKYSQPRCYYHSVVQFNPETMRPESFAAPFSFCDPKIEYCLGFNIKENGEACFVFSRNDCDPCKITVPFSHLRMLTV